MNYRSSAKVVSLHCDTVSSNSRSTVMPESRIPEIEIPTAESRNRAVHMNGRFLKGPIPMSELWAAARLSGQALAVYLAIRHQCDLTGKATVTLPRALLEHFGIDKDAKARALKYLAGAGLVTLEQRCGRSARVTLVTEYRKPQ